MNHEAGKLRCATRCKREQEEQEEKDADNVRAAKPVSSKGWSLAKQKVSCTRCRLEVRCKQFLAVTGEALCPASGETSRSISLAWLSAFARTDFPSKRAVSPQSGSSAGEPMRLLYKEKVPERLESEPAGGEFNSTTAARGIGCVSSDGGETLRDLQIYISPESEHWLDCFHITMRLTVMGLRVKGADKASSTRARTCDSKFGALGKLRLTGSIMYRVTRCRLACPQNCLLGSAIYHAQPWGRKIRDLRGRRKQGTWARWARPKGTHDLGVPDKLSA